MPARNWSREEGSSEGAGARPAAAIGFTTMASSPQCDTSGDGGVRVAGLTRGGGAYGAALQRGVN